MHSPGPEGAEWFSNDRLMGSTASLRDADPRGKAGNKYPMEDSLQVGGVEADK